MLVEQRLHLVEALTEGLSTQTKAIDKLTLQQVALEKELKLASRAGAFGDMDFGKQMSAPPSSTWNVVGREPNKPKSSWQHNAFGIPGAPLVISPIEEMVAADRSCRKSFEDRASIAMEKFRQTIYADMAHNLVKVKKSRSQQFLDFCMELVFKPPCKRNGLHPVVWIRRGLKDAVAHPYFDVVFCILILVNAALIGVEVELSKNPSWELKYVMRSFSLIFAVELLLRMHAAGWSFWRPPQLKGNLFDMFLLSTFASDWFDRAEGTEFLRFLRFARILRAFRAIRLASYAPEFRKMAYALQHSVLTLFWALLLLFFIIYCFAATLTQAARFHLEEHSTIAKCPENGKERLAKFWGSLPRSTYSLYASICGGYSWNELAEPLSCCGPLYVAIFIIYTSVAIFGVLNVVTSVFVDSAMESTQHFVDIKIGEALNSKQVLVNHLRQMFEDLDVDNSGEISIEEMEVLMQNTQLAHYLEAIDIRHDEVDLLFQMLDFDGSGSISTHEFCEGCLRLMGQAKSFDIHRMNDTMQSIMYFSEKTMAKVADVVTMLNNCGLTTDMPPRKSRMGGLRTSNFMFQATTLRPMSRRISPFSGWSAEAAPSGMANSPAQVDVPRPIIKQVRTDDDDMSRLDVYRI